MYHYAIEWYRLNTDKHNHLLKNIYEVAGISKQAHQQYMKRREQYERVSQIVVGSILEVREMHPKMGLKKIFKLFESNCIIGRDGFLSISMEHNLGIKRQKSFQRTTFSCKSAWFTNLTAGLQINDINKVWTSDITYYRMGDTFYYLTFIVDVYSRRILGWAAHTNLEAVANCKALSVALSERAGYNLKGLIHHSDKGSQYISNKYLKLLSDNKVAVSMCDSVYENTHIERVNGIIKNEYLYPKSIKSFKELSQELPEVVRLYNEERPHWSLNLMTPVQYEEEIKKIPLEQREVLVIYSESKKHYAQLTIF